MFEDWKCVHCHKKFKWEQLKSTPSGNLFCAECWPLIDPANEPVRKCPVDNVNMKKALIDDSFIIDNCPTCGGVWLDKGELERLEKEAKDDGWNWGFVIGHIF